MSPKKFPGENLEDNETRGPNIIEQFEQFYKSHLKLVNALQKEIEHNLETVEMHKRHLAEINKPHVKPDDEDYAAIARKMAEITEKKPKQLLELQEMLSDAKSELAEILTKLDHLKEQKKPELIN